jgi:hypothetical protein
MIGSLPNSLTVGGKKYPIRTDYRNVLQTFEAFNDPELESADKWMVAIYLLFEDFTCADDVEEAYRNGFDLEEAIKQIAWFISAGKPEKKDDRPEPPTYDWEQDEQMIFSEINKVAPCTEVRELDYLHWWTFLGYFNAIGEGTFSYVVGIRQKLNHGKKLEKHEREFVNRNKEMVVLKKKLTEEEQKQEDEFQSLLDSVL